MGASPPGEPGGGVRPRRRAPGMAEGPAAVARAPRRPRAAQGPRRTAGPPAADRGAAARLPAADRGAGERPPPGAPLAAERRLAVGPAVPGGLLMAAQRP